MNPKTEALVKNAVQTWDIAIKGYAIFAMKALHMGELKESLLPLLDKKETRGIALQALAESPTPRDRAVLETQYTASSEIPKEILNAYFRSSSEETVKQWLALVRDKTIPQKYIFFVFEQPLLSSDALLDAVHETIRSTRNRSILHELPRALAGRTDDESVNLLISLLSDADPTTRYWAAFSLKGNHSPKLVATLPELIANASLRTVALTDLAIDNLIGNLSAIYREILKAGQSPSNDWRRSAEKYLAAFPASEDAPLFYSILKGKCDSFSKRAAAMGLSRLKDPEAVDAIILAMREEPPSDLNARTYLVALSRIKGPKAQETVESYRESKEEPVHKLVAELVRNWNAPSGENEETDFSSSPILSNLP